MPSNRWREVGAQIQAERSRRWSTRDEFARASGVSKRVLCDLENGKRGNYTESTLGQVEGALGWEPGEILARAAGRRVDRAPDRELRRIRDAWPNLSTDARRILADLAENALRDR